MAQLHSIVDLRLSEPGLLIPGGEYLDSYTLPHPRPPPHLTIPAFTWKQSGTVTYPQDENNSKSKTVQERRRTDTLDQ